MYIPIWMLAGLLILFVFVVLASVYGLEDQLKKLRERVKNLEEDMEEAKLSPDEKYKREMRRQHGPPDYPGHPLDDWSD